MLTIEIINDGTGDEKNGNYDYRVLVNGREIDRGRVEGHYRPAGWPSLASAVAQEARRQKTIKGYVALFDAIQEEEATRAEQSEAT